MKVFTNFNTKNKSFFLTALFFVSYISLISQTVTITAPVATASYCAGQTINLTYSLSPATFTAGNIFTPQLSDASGALLVLWI